MTDSNRPDRDEKPYTLPPLPNGKKVSVAAALASAITAVVITALLCFALFIAAMAKERENLGFLRKVQQLDEIYRAQFAGDINYDKVTSALLSAYVESVDKYGYYLGRDDYSNTMSELSSNTVGIGVYVVSRANGAEVVHVMAGSPAEKIGMQVGDIVFESNGRLYAEARSFGEFIESCRGAAGETGTIRWIRGGELMSSEVTYAKYYIETVFPKNLGNGVGYVYIASFDQGTSADFRAAVDGLLEEGCDRFVFDLRNNGGGLLGTVTSMVDYVTGSGTIVTITDVSGNVAEKYVSDEKDAIAGMKCAVLINGRSASASELFAAALRDLRGAPLVGERSYGKGTLQHIISLGDGTGVGVTTNYFNPPSSPNFDGVGLAPDIAASLPGEAFEYSIFTMPLEIDTQLQAAVGAVSVPE